MTARHTPFSGGRPRPSYAAVWLRRPLLWMLWILPAVAVMAAPTATTDSAALFDLRILQYELVLGDTLTPEVGVCIDQTLGHHSDFPLTGVPPSQREMDNLAQTAEQCSTDSTEGTRRFIGEIKAAFAPAIVARAASLPAARRCLSESGNLDALRSCVTTAIGFAPTSDEWPQWTALYAQWRK